MYPICNHVPHEASRLRRAEPGDRLLHIAPYRPVGQPVLAARADDHAAAAVRLVQGDVLDVGAVAQGIGQQHQEGAAAQHDAYGARKAISLNSCN